MTFTISDLSIIIIAIIFISHSITKYYYLYKIEQLKEYYTQILNNAFKNHNTTKTYCEPTVFKVKKMSYDNENKSN